MKETKIEKLILDLSNRWDCSPQEAVDRLNSMNESEINKLINSMTKKFQVGGSIASRIWNRIKGTDTYVDGYGVTRHHVPVRESAWRTTKTFTNSPLTQAIPIVGDLADGVNAVDYATKGDYLPATMAIGMGFLTPNSAEVGYKMVDGDDYVARVIRERQQKAAEEAAERQAIAKSSKNQYKKGARGRFSKESLEHDNPHISNIPKNRDYSGSLDQNAHDLFIGQDYVDMHKNGGFIDCLRNGGSISKCKCGCDKIAKAQGGLSELRQRGVTPAYRGAYPEFNEADSTWVRTPDGYMKNTFSGNTLEQNLVTYDEGGVPRRSVRRITNYDIPAQADTTYRDARGLWSSRNPSWLAKLTGNVHSTRFMDNVDSNLEGFEPAQLNEREVRKTQKKACGGPLPKKSKFKK